MRPTHWIAGSASPVVDEPPSLLLSCAIVVAVDDIEVSTGEGTTSFEDDGDVTIRTYYKVPRHSNAEIGKLFQTYLP